MSDYGKEQFSQYYARLRDELDAVKFFIPFKQSPLDNHGRPRDPHQIRFHLKGAALRCYHNFEREGNDAPRYLYVGIGCDKELQAPFNDFFLREKTAMEKKLGYKLAHKPGQQGKPGDFWAEGVPVVGELESLIPVSVGRLQNFREVVFPAVLKAFAD